MQIISGVISQVDRISDRVHSFSINGNKISLKSHKPILLAEGDYAHVAGLVNNGLVEAYACQNTSNHWHTEVPPFFPPLWILYLFFVLFCLAAMAFWLFLPFPLIVLLMIIRAHFVLGRFRKANQALARIVNK